MQETYHLFETRLPSIQFNFLSNLNISIITKLNIVIKIIYKFQKLVQNLETLKPLINSIE